MPFTYDDIANEDAEYPALAPTPLDNMTEDEALAELSYLYSDDFLDKLFD